MPLPSPSEIENSHVCPYAPHHCYGWGSLQPEVMLVGVAPGVDRTLNASVPMIGPCWTYGPSTECLHDALSDLGMSHDVWLTNLLKCPTPGNRSPRVSEVEDQLPVLKAEVHYLRPKLILTLGVDAGTLMMQNIEGEFEGIKKIGIKHPAYFVRMGRQREYSAEIERALVNA